MISTFFNRKVNKRLSKKNLINIIFGGVYTVQKGIFPEYDSLDVRIKTGYFVPMRIEDNDEQKYYMVDTYQFPQEWFGHTMRGPKTTFDAICIGLNNLEDVGLTKELYKKSVFESCPAIIEITDKTIQYFKLYFDIHHCEPKTFSSVRGYYNNDIYPFVRFFKDFNFIKGDKFCLVDKKAQRSKLVPLFKQLQSLRDDVYTLTALCEKYDNCMKYINDNEKSLKAEGFNKEDLHKLDEFYNNLKTICSSHIEIDNYEDYIDYIFRETFLPDLTNKNNVTYNWRKQLTKLETLSYEQHEV